MYAIRSYYEAGFVFPLHFSPEGFSVYKQFRLIAIGVAIYRHDIAFLDIATRIFIGQVPVRHQVNKPHQDGIERQLVNQDISGAKIV